MFTRSFTRPAMTTWFCFSLLIGAGAAPAGKAVPVSADYVQALGAASRFLGAWVWRDQQRGPALVSSRLRKAVSADDLRMYFSGVSNPHHEGFEIRPGRRLSADRYVFPVRLYTYYTADPKPRPALPLSSIVVVRERAQGKRNDAVWVVDNLPAG